ncbi:MAG TPA: dihydroorotase [bacterium]|nr:dihydroorotase [Candidatus Omnitrophota bacterium]HOJ60652.1 dihydroorotase [bacterium]HOL93872.1 dihydroorotase [bacterium]HPP00449.1 dihydroorotase [bacterium]
MKTLIHHARILNPADQEDRIADVLLDGPVIAAIEPSISSPGAEIVEAEGLWLMPGLIDIHVHLREPGFEGRETIATGTKAAAAGGITSVVCMGDTNPPVDDKTGVEFILERAAQTGWIRVYPCGTLTKNMEGKEIAPIGEMVEAGAVAITDDAKSVMDSLVMFRALQYSTIFGIPIITHPEDTILVDNNCGTDGPMSVKLGLLPAPREAESAMVARDLLLAKSTGAHIHIAHLSTADSVDLLRFYKKKGVNATGETAPHFLVLTEDATEDFNTHAKTNPPLRTQEDQDALYEGLRDGTIDCIATDHSPCSMLEKNQEYPIAPAGVIGLETLLPLLLNPIRERSGLDLLALLRLVTCQPARVMNLPGGRLAPGEPADLVLWNPETRWSIDKEKFFSKSRNTPFHGWPVQGQVVSTYAAGRLVYSRDECPPA